jgi:hypothetical protein
MERGIKGHFIMENLHLGDHHHHQQSSWVPVTHACNSGGKDQKDHGGKPVNSLRDPIWKITNTKRGLAKWFKWYLPSKHKS